MLHALYAACIHRHTGAEVLLQNVELRTGHRNSTAHSMEYVRFHVRLLDVEQCPLAEIRAEFVRAPCVMTTGIFVRPLTTVHQCC